jgi:hypothetical protein
MFDSSVSGLDAVMTASLISRAHRRVLEQECLLLDLAAHWADLNHPASASPIEQTLPGGEQARTLGGEGPQRSWSSLRPNWALGWKPRRARRGR